MLLDETLNALALTVRYAGSTFVLYVCSLKDEMGSQSGWLMISSVQYLLVFSYRLLLHPLRSYPDPLLARITDGYAGLHALSRNLPITTYRDHLEHGTIQLHAIRANTQANRSQKALSSVLGQTGWCSTQQPPSKVG